MRFVVELQPLGALWVVTQEYTQQAPRAARDIGGVDAPVVVGVEGAEDVLGRALLLEGGTPESRSAHTLESPIFGETHAFLETGTFYI